MSRYKSTRPDFVVENIYRLADFRKKAGITQRELAETAGIAISLINGYENFSFPTKEKYNKLAEFFGWQKWED